MNGDKVVKCACGLPMRQRDWSDHWRTCYKACGVEVTQSDIDALEAYEARQKENV